MFAVLHSAQKEEALVTEVHTAAVNNGPYISMVPELIALPAAHGAHKTIRSGFEGGVIRQA
jgi:hypothetical protein